MSADANVTRGDSLTELVQAETVNLSIKDFLIDLPVISPLAEYVNMTGKGTRVHSFPLWVKDTGADLTEAEAMTATELETTQVSVTIAQVGILREVTTFVAETSVISPQELFAKIREDGVKLVIEMLEDDLAALFASLTGATIGTSGSDLSLANIVESAAKARTLKLRGQLAGVLDDQQGYDLMAAVMASTATGLNGNIDQSVLNASTDGYIGSLLRIPFFVTNLTDTANGAADVVGALFVTGASNAAHCPISFCDLGPPKMLQDVNVTMPSYRISTVYTYGVAATYPGAGQNYTTDA